MIRRYAALVLVTMVLAAACATRRPAPVTERAPPPPLPVPQAVQPVSPPVVPAAKPVPTHTVRRGETLVGIALQYGLDYRELAAWNGIANPNLISVDQVLFLASPQGAPAGTPAIVATPLAQTGPIVEARPLANTDRLKVEPRGQRLPYSDKALAQVSAGEAMAEPAPAVAPTPVPATAPPAAPAAPAAVPEPERPSAGTQGEAIDWIWPAKGKVLAGFTE
ncbi:MAG TPA: LysM peptidoglycan-binding domain-containing protein, partial [Usitatibacteraceae bacterium]|nr:LysM peptidoglycan-binding domain-containing protein [Usitatibacteraceae bacterium]